jgi:murein DD-endopeptidase MepM/ murein hydrolase activator NlpD
MKRVVWVRLVSPPVLASVLASVLVVGAGAATAPVPGATATARALAVRIVFPDGRVVGSRAADAVKGPRTVAAASYAYPASGSVVVTGSIGAAAATKMGKTANGTASTRASNVSLFEGEITADSVASGSSAAATAHHAGGAFRATEVVHLQALGRAHAFGRATLGDWGTLAISHHLVDRGSAEGTKGYTGATVAVDVTLTAAHGGLPAGTEIQLGYASAGAQTAPPVVPASGPVAGDRPQLLPPPTGPLVGLPQVSTPELTATPYVYPVFGGTTVSDGYGSPTAGGGWVRGADIYGRLGQPVVAVAAGSLYGVGWNRASGNKLWLRDTQGNEFLYTHLSAFSKLASNGAHVRAGQVIGFMGSTGTSAGSRVRMHFELHPVSMLFLGNGGAVDPGSYLAGWRHLSGLAFPIAAGWAPKVPGTISPPTPGAVLIGSSDISTADGLDPASLRRAVRPRTKR